MSRPRVGLIGARRARQGLGPFVARDLVAAGLEVPCFLVTRESSIAPAREELERFAGISPRAYTDLDALLGGEDLQSLAILSPAHVHAEHLERAAECGLAVLCEKPLVWGVDDLADRAAECVAAFESRGLLLYENCQWPFTLEAFERLHPGALDAPPRRFRMELEPASRGVAALGDALSHPLSVLQALLPGPARLDAVRFSDGSDPLTIGFNYVSGDHACEVEISLAYAASQPRHAALEVDGRRAERVVALETYQLSFAVSHRSVQLDDPLTSLVADFARKLSTPDEADRISRARDIALRMGLLAELVRAYPHQETP